MRNRDRLKPLISKLLLFGLLLAGLFATGASAETTLAAGDASAVTVPNSWKTYLYNNARTGFNPLEVNINSSTVGGLSQKWSVNLSAVPANIFTQPIITPDRVYWGAFDGYERAFTTQGKGIWKTYLGQTNVDSTICFPQTVGVTSTGTLAAMSIGAATNVLFLGGGNYKFYALDADTGKILWSRALGTSPDYFIWGSPALYGGNLYIGIASFCDNPLVRGRLYKLSATTGQIVGVFNVVPRGCLGGTIWSTPTIDAAAGVLYVSTGNPDACTTAEPLANALLKLRLSDLALLDSWALPPAQTAEDSDFGATPTLFNAGTVPMIGVINKSGMYYAFRRSSLSKGPVWSTQVAAANCPQCFGLNLSPSAYDGVRLYVGGSDTVINGTYCPGTLAAVNPFTGQYKWQLCLPDGAVMGAVTAVPGLVAVTEGNKILVVDARTGQTRFSYTAATDFWAPVTMANGLLITGDNGGTLHAFGF